MEKKINLTSLEEMITSDENDDSDLDNDELNSIIFLMTDPTNITFVSNVLNESPYEKYKFIINQKNWEKKLLECLIIVQNFNIIFKLGYREDEVEEMKDLYLNTFSNSNLNTSIKILYYVFDNLKEADAKKLILKINSDLKSSAKNIPFNIETHILRWIQQKFISIEKVAASEKLLSIFRSFNFGNPMLSLFSIKKRLCIIVNEIEFNWADNRSPGTIIDQKNLEKTFGGCGFEVKSYKNLNKMSMVKLLDGLNTNTETHYISYECIFMCILSHGQEDAIILSDDEVFPLKTIREKFCCKNLEKVFKFIIIEACQGAKTGLLKKHSSLSINEPVLQTDSPKKFENEIIELIDANYNPNYFKQFGLFLATISSYRAVLSKTEGSWFIQDLCDVIRNCTPMEISKMVKAVTVKVNKRRKDLGSKFYYVQLPHFKDYVMVDEYFIPKYEI